MRATESIQQQFAEDLRGVHLARVRVVFAAVRAVLHAGRLSLTSIGRSIAIETSPKHGIKRIDRLLGNGQLHQERLTFYAAIARRLIPPASRPVILVDWTSVTPQLWALVAAIGFEGRALIVYAEAHPISRYAKPYVNAAFLSRLQQVLPRGCRPIIVTDAGFRSPWMKLVASFGWDFLTRVRAPVKIRRQHSVEWTNVDAAWRFARRSPCEIGTYEIGRKQRHRCRFVGVRKSAAPIRVPSLRDSGPVRQRRNAREPWILATSLRCRPAKIVAMYRRRMQIEETFRDAKSSRFGLALAQARTSCEERANVLLLLASLAHVVAVLVGIAAEALGIHRRFQANTVRSRRVLSVAMLGRLVLACGLESTLNRTFPGPAWNVIAAKARALDA